MKRDQATTKEYRDQYREKGLVILNAWIPAEHKDRLLTECRLLREEHLAKQVLQRPKGPTEVIKA